MSSSNNNDSEFSKEDFDKAISDHKLWLTNPLKGRRAVFEGRSFINNDFTDYEAIDFTKAIIKNCDFSQLDINHCEIEFNECLIEDCTFDQSIINAWFDNARVLNCTFIDADLDNSNFKNVEMLNCTYNGENYFVKECQKNSLNKLLEEREDFKKLKENITSQTNENQQDTARRYQLSTMSKNSQIEQPSKSRFAFLNSGPLNFIKDSISAGVQITVGNKISALLDSHVHKALKTAGVPIKVLEHKATKMLLSICTPQALKLLIPLIPKISSSEIAIKAIELACFFGTESFRRNIKLCNFYC